MRWSPISKLLSPSGKHAVLSIFIFHRVLEKMDPLLPYEPSAKQFDWMIRFISQSFSVISLKDAATHLINGTLPAAAAVITFDDGYVDNFDVAWPILQRYGVSATFFIATAFLDGGRMWNDEVIEAVRRFPGGVLDLNDLGLGQYVIDDSTSRVSCYDVVLGKLKYFEHESRSMVAKEIGSRIAESERTELMMTTAQLRELHNAGAEIGGHTRTHPILERLDDDVAFHEIEAGKHELESIVGDGVKVFAYPNGVPNRDCSRRHGDMLKKLGFEAAVTTEPSCSNARSDVFFLPRFTPWDRTPLRFAFRSLTRLVRAHV